MALECIRAVQSMYYVLESERVISATSVLGRVVSATSVLGRVISATSVLERAFTSRCLQCKVYSQCRKQYMLTDSNANFNSGAI